MKPKTTLQVILLALFICFTTVLLAQNDTGEVDTSDEALKERKGGDTIGEMIFTGLMYLIVPTEDNEKKIDIETGIVYTGYSDVRIPGDNGTLFSLSKDLKAEITPAYRFRVSQRFADRHNVSILAAPLHVVSNGTIDRDVDFAGETFEEGTKLKGTYWFNSYRLTYRYDIVNNFTTEFGLGFTAKIREAGIMLESSTIKAKKTNVGFVPIINFRYDRYLGNKLSLLIEGDALAAPQGRAEDIYAGIKYKLADWAKLKLGYRLLEGGADNDKVYNFALFHYATVGFEFGY